ncbi:hypothetical protein GCM10027093_73940 [Paraburkholderia jirisanensis]
MKKWTDIEALPRDTLTPAQYTWKQLVPEDIDELIRGIRQWWPDISFGSGRVYVDDAFYRDRTSFHGDPERDIIVYVGRYEGAIISVLCLERFPDSLTLLGRFGACAEEHRGTGSALFAGYIMDQQAKTMGYAMVYSYVTLKSKGMQALLEHAGFRPVGIVPCSDRELVGPGVVGHVNEVLYAKVYVPAKAILPVDQQCMTDSVQALWHLIFEKSGEREKARLI